MPEIISLLSSPFDGPPKQQHGGPCRSPSAALAKDIFSFGSDDFDLTSLSGDLAFPVLQRTKRRKLNPNDRETASLRKPRNVQIYTISDDEDVPLPHASIANGRQSAELQWDALASDPIGFSSSAPELRVTGNSRTNILDLSDDLPEDIMAIGESVSLSQPAVAGSGRMHLSERTANVLAGLNTKTDTMGLKNGGCNNTKKRTDMSRYVEDIFSSSPMSKITTKRIKPSKPTDATKGLRAAERGALKATKEREKEEEKERKRRDKEQLAKEKQEAADIAEVNKSKTDKKASVTEMIVDMSRGLEGKSVGNQVVEYMKHLQVDTTFFDGEVDLLQVDEAPETYGNLVKWRRKVKARYNEDAGHWVPISESRIENERHILIHLTATDFASLATLRARARIEHQESTISEEAMMRNIDQHVSNLRRKYKECKPLYLIEGLEAFLRKNRTAKNRAYTAAVRSQLPASDPSAPPATGQARQRKKANTTPDHSFIDTDIAESLLLHLQLNHSVLIHHTTSPSDTASWIRTFTEHISTIPYRHERMSLNDAGAAFCMDVGQVKTGDDARDTYVKMLQEVQRVTPAMAYGIANLYPSVQALARAFREEGPLVLEDVKKGANRDGAVTDSRLGPAVSKRLYKVFMGRNEWSTDGIA